MKNDNPFSGAGMVSRKSDQACSCARSSSSRNPMGRDGGGKWRVGATWQPACTPAGRAGSAVLRAVSRLAQQHLPLQAVPQAQLCVPAGCAPCRMETADAESPVHVIKIVAKTATRPA